jgi:histone deacetylase 1/2
MQHIIDWYRPGAIVLQMGADSLAGDKLGGFNLTLDGKLTVSSCNLKLTN